MANVTISVQSFLNSSTNLSITIADSSTVSNLKTAINSAEGVNTAIMDLFFNGVKLANASTLASYSIITGSYIRTSNNLTQDGLWTKQQRQVLKLDLATLKRIRDNNPRSIYSLSELPDTYNGNIPGPDDNPNTGGLIIGRPWVNWTAGAYRTTYSGYHGDDVTFTDTATVTGTTIVGNFTIPSEPENTTELYIGYILSDYTGTWSFTITSDDASYIWIGPTALSGYTTGNALTSASYLGPGTGTISLSAGYYYPVRLLYGNGPSGGSLNLTYAHTGQSATNNFTGKLFFNSSTNGF